MKAKLSDLMLAVELPMDESTYYLDRETGEALLVTAEDERMFEEGFEGDFVPDWQLENFKRVRPILEEREQDRYIELPTPFDFHEYSHMEGFVWQLKNGSHREQLERALQGRGAFRRFKDTIYELGISKEWFRYRDIALKRFILEWCESEGIPVLDDKPSLK